MGACAVQSKDETGITIEYPSNQPAFAQWAADDHCAKLGKRAVLKHTGPRNSNYGLIPETSVAEFDCVN